MDSAYHSLMNIDDPFNCRAIFLFVCGLFIGSFVNCIAQRILLSQSWTISKSRCDHCGHTLGLCDLIPILSYVVQKGRCRYCHEKISIRYPLIELLSGSVFILLYYSHPHIDAYLIRNLILASVLLGLSLVDMDSFMIPDGFIITGLINWIVSVFLVSDQKNYIIKGISGAMVIAGSLYLLTIIMNRMLHKESMGGGDIKLIFMLGLYFGTYYSIWILMIACLFALVFILITRRKMIPFGPFLSLSAIVVKLLFR